MDQSDKSRFILALHKHSLEAFGMGGIAGAVGGLLGLNNTFQAQGTDIQRGTNQGQLDQAYQGAQSGIQQQQQFANQAGAQNGFGNQSAVFGQQQALANQLQNQANGQGPNPAQAALAQSTGQNIASQAALMAGQRGASANVGQMARQAAMQGAATQQQAVGQGATLQAQQQLAAQQALANQQAQMQNVAGNQIGTQGGALGSLSGAQQNEQNILQNANTNANNANVAMQSNINSVNAGVEAGNQKTGMGMLGGIAGGIGGALSGAKSFFGLAEGGEVPDHIAHMASIYHPHLAKGGNIEALKSGGQVPGKPQVNHNDYKNDKVPAVLSPGEVVLDLDTMNDKGPIGKMARALAAHIKQRNGKK